MTKEIEKVAVFKGKKIRKTLYKNAWWFSVVDIVEALTDSAKPRVYWNAMKTRVKGETGIELSTICRQLKLASSDGKKYETDCADTEGIFRIIQSSPSPKAELTAPFQFLGRGVCTSYEGNRPIAMVWQLEHPMPAELLEANRVGG